MKRELISHGASDEVFIMGDLGLKVDIATLIKRVNSAPRDNLDIREESTEALMGVAQRNGSNPYAEIPEERSEEPVLFLVLTFHGERQHWVIDGTHRLRARYALGMQTTRIVALRPHMASDLICPI